MDTTLYIPTPTAPLPAVRRSKWPRFLLLTVATALGLALLLGLLHRLATSERAQQAAVTLGGGALGIAIASVLLIIAVLWILFPVFVYFSLERMKKALDQIERNTRNS
jgi:uncharacterized membrane protein